MPLGEAAEKKVEEYLRSVEIPVDGVDEGFRFLGSVKPTDEAVWMAKRIIEILGPEVDLMIDSARRAGYNAGTNRIGIEEGTDPLGIMPKPGDDSDPRHPDQNAAGEEIQRNPG